MLKIDKKNERHRKKKRTKRKKHRNIKVNAQKISILFGYRNIKK